MLKLNPQLLWRLVACAALLSACFTIHSTVVVTMTIATTKPATATATATTVATLAAGSLPAEAASSS